LPKSGGTRPDPHKRRFVLSIRRLLVKAGFPKEEIEVRGDSEQGPDLILSHRTEEGKTIKILFQCKHSDNPAEFGSLDTLIRNYATYVADNHANCAVLVLGGYSIPPSYRENSVRMRILRKRKVAYWGERELMFYKKTVNSLRSPYSRYYILRDLGFQIRLQKKPYVVDVVQAIQQPSGERFFLFSIEPRKLLNIAYVFRRGMTDPHAYQRILKGSRLRNVGEFISSREGILANSIIVSFDAKRMSSGGGKLRIPAKTCSAWIIDGQHRLYGFANLHKRLTDRTRNRILAKFKLNVVGMNTDEAIQGNIFTRINAFQKAISRNLLLDLCYYLGIPIGEGVLPRVGIALRLSRASPFVGRLKVIPTDDGTITLASLVDYYRFRSIVNQYGGRAYTKVRSFFNAINEVFPNEWDDPKNFVLATNKGIRISLSLLSRTLDYCEREGIPQTREAMTTVVQALKDATIAERDFFKNSSYKGKALGAGAPDLVARDLWSAKVCDVIPEFLSQDEKRKIGRDEKSLLKDLELKLRGSLTAELSRIAGASWWNDPTRIPQTIHDLAEDRKQRNEKPWPWMGERRKPVIHYLDFTDYRQVIIKRNNWHDVFSRIFKNRTILESKLMELEPIRVDISHTRSLSPESMEILRVNSRHLIRCIEDAAGAPSSSPPSQTP
jgi:DNA sulfur modification protein DndB